MSPVLLFNGLVAFTLTMLVNVSVSDAKGPHRNSEDQVRPPPASANSVACNSTVLQFGFAKLKEEKIYEPVKEISVMMIKGLTAGKHAVHIYGTASCLKGFSVMSPPSHPHAITISPNPNRVKVTFNGTVIADTRRALILREGTLPPAHYIPREDVRMTYLRPTTHSTHCPFKGGASYFTVDVGDKTAENAVWTYAAPLPAVADIKNHVAFYPEKMDAIEELAGDS